jgi:hypothetical protein
MKKLVNLLKEEYEMYVDAYARMSKSVQEKTNKHIRRVK